MEPVLVDSVLNHTPMGGRTEHPALKPPPRRATYRASQAKSLMEDSELDAAVLAGPFLDPELLHKAQAGEVLCGSSPAAH